MAATGLPASKKLFSNATTETLHKHVDEVVNIGGIVASLKRTKIKK